jgi:hypothetical protein
MPNQNFIKAHGIQRFLEQQKERMRLLETMITECDDGRSKSFFCRAAVLLNVQSLRKSHEKASERIRTEKVKPGDVRVKAQILKAILKEAALDEGVEFS